MKLHINIILLCNVKYTLKIEITQTNNIGLVEHHTTNKNDDLSLSRISNDK